MFTGKIRVLAGAINCNLNILWLIFNVSLLKSPFLTLKFQVFAIGFDANKYFHKPYAPCMFHIYQQNWVIIYGQMLVKSSSTMLRIWGKILRNPAVRFGEIPWEVGALVQKAIVCEEDFAERRDRARWRCLDDTSAWMFIN